MIAMVARPRVEVLEDAVHSDRVVVCNAKGV